MAQPLGVQYGQKFTLTGPDGTVAVFNDPTDPNYVGALIPEQCTGLDSADVRENADDLVQMDGGIHGDFFYGRRPLTLAGKIFNTATVTERNQKIDALKRASNAMRPVSGGAGPAAAQGNARLAWTAAGGVPVQIDIRRQQPTRVTGTGWDKDFQAQMVAADPRVYSQALYSSYYPAGVAGSSGLSFAPFAGNFAGATPAFSIPVLNDGTDTTYPVYYINGPCVNPSIYNATTGRAIAFGYTLAANEGLVVDTLNRTVYYGTRATITNLIANPSAEASPMAGAGASWTVTRVASTGNPAGGWVNQHTFTGAGGGDTNMGAFVFIAPSAGTYVMSGYVYMGSAYAGPLPFLTTDGSFTGGTTVTTVGADTTKRDQWQRIYTVFTVAAGDLTGSLVMRNPANPGTAGAYTMYSDAYQVQSGSVPTGYGDGSFSGWSWTGAANASSSTGPGGDVVATSTNRYGAVDFTNTLWDGLRSGVNDVRFIPYSWSAGAGLRVDWRYAWL